MLRAEDRELMKEAEKVQCGEGLEQSWEKSHGAGWKGGLWWGARCPGRLGLGWQAPT